MNNDKSEPQCMTLDIKPEEKPVKPIFIWQKKKYAPKIKAESKKELSYCKCSDIFECSNNGLDKNRRQSYQPYTQDMCSEKTSATSLATIKESVPKAKFASKRSGIPKVKTTASGDYYQKVSVDSKKNVKQHKNIPPTSRRTNTSFTISNKSINIM